MSAGMKCGVNKLRVPPGFSVLLEKLAMEILREQPADIVQFSSKYFKQLLSEKETTGIDPCEVAISKSSYLDSFETEQVEQENKTSDDSADASAALLIQSNYRGYATRKHTQQLKQQRNEAASKIQSGYRGHLKQRQESATKIQATFKGYKVRKTLDKSKTIEEEVKEEDLDASATKIQATYRGYKARKEMNDTQSQVKTFLSDVEKAAIKIQSSYRGYSTRKKMTVRKQEPTDSDN